MYAEGEPVTMSLAAGLHVVDALARKVKPFAPPDIQVAIAVEHHFSNGMLVGGCSQDVLQRCICETELSPNHFPGGLIWPAVD